MRQNAVGHPVFMHEVITLLLHAAAIITRWSAARGRASTAQVPVLAGSNSRITAATAKKPRTGPLVLEGCFTEVYPIH